MDDSEALGCRSRERVQPSSDERQGCTRQQMTTQHSVFLFTPYTPLYALFGAKDLVANPLRRVCSEKLDPKVVGTRLAPSAQMGVDMSEAAGQR